MRFRDPVLLMLMLLIPIIVWVRMRYVRPVTMKFSALETLRHVITPGGGRFTRLVLTLRCAALVLMVLALARPLRGIAHTRVFGEGIDIILALDVSSSMDARDMTPDLAVNRLDATKAVVKKFILQRKNDRLGIVAFARYAYAQSPLTLDHDLLVEIVDRLKTVPQGGDEDGTAIGSAIVTSVARLKESKAKSKVIVLLTDGMNNFGEISPESAAEVAKSMKVKIYTIGAGTRGLAPYPVRMFGQMTFTRVKIDIDEESLKKIAAITGGRYYRAQDERALGEIYEQINTMEKVKIEEEKYTEYRDLFPYLLFPALLLLLAEAVVGHTVLRRLP